SSVATAASSFRRAADSDPSGTSSESCSGVARREPGCNSGRAALVIGSELEQLAVLQHPRPDAAGDRLDFLHRELDLARLEVRDPDLGPALELRELVGE